MKTLAVAAAAIVLNAFRHQGGRHTAQFLELQRLVLVLNAFRHQGGRHRARRFYGHASPGAQRLSASVMKTHLPHQLSHPRFRVLNAFRHQGGRHALDFAAQDRRNHVLNAFRHQGGRHEFRQDYLLRLRSVLNAFRHQGGRHQR